MEIPPYINIDQQSYTLSLTPEATDKKQKAMWGMSRTREDCDWDLANW